jgi:thiamine biosynthesis lipoprotein
MQRMVAEERFRVMGTDAHVVVVGAGPDAVHAARFRLMELEASWSRFLETSEVSALNREAGHEVAVSFDTELLVRRALDAWRLSGASVDPTVLGAVVRAGYDRSFDRLDDPAAPTSPWGHLGAGADGIEVGPGWVRLPEGTGFDPGGVGKGLAADLVATELLARGAAGALVNVGGDLRVSGESPEGGDEGWTVAVELEGRDRPVVHLGLQDGGVATSTTLKRRWAGGHHLIDPATGRPSDTHVVLATAVAGTAWEAEAMAKALLLRGRRHDFAILGGTGIEGLVVTDDGSVLASPGLAAFTGTEVPA